MYYTTSVTAHYDVMPTEKADRLDEACSTFFNWKDSVIENAREYEKRIKKLKLLEIMKEIFEKELTQTQKDIVRLHYFERRNGEEIATLYGINRSTVSRMISKIESIFRENMKYAFVYSELCLADEAPPVSVAQAIAVMTENAVKTEHPGERIRKLRNSKLLTLEQTAAATGIPKSRLETIEKSGNMTLQEIKRILFFFSVSADFIVLGV